MRAMIRKSGENVCSFGKATIDSFVLLVAALIKPTVLTL